MTNHAKIAVAVIVAVIVCAGIYIATKDDSDNQPASTETSQTAESTTAESSQEDTEQTTEQPAEAAVTITYTNSGFEPDDSTIQSGQSVKIVNNSDQELDFASNAHPVHTDNSELNAGSISPGASKTIKLTETGEWGFHNHLNSGHSGHIHVQ